MKKMSEKFKAAYDELNKDITFEMIDKSSPQVWEMVADYADGIKSKYKIADLSTDDKLILEAEYRYLDYKHSKAIELDEMLNSKRLSV